MGGYSTHLRSLHLLVLMLFAIHGRTLCLSKPPVTFGDPNGHFRLNINKPEPLKSSWTIDNRMAMDFEYLDYPVDVELMKARKGKIIYIDPRQKPDVDMPPVRRRVVVDPKDQTWNITMNEGQLDLKMKFPIDGKTLNFDLNGFKLTNETSEQIFAMQLNEFKPKENINHAVSTRFKRQAHEEEEGGDEEDKENDYLSSAFNVVNADFFWLKLVVDTVVNFIFGVTSSVSYYVLHVVGLGHLISTGEMIGVLWSLYDSGSSLVQWLAQRA